MSRLSQEDLRTLEQTRQRLFQLTNSIASLKTSILSQPVLPPWSSLHTTSSILAGNMSELAKHLTTHHELFSHLAVYPQTNFPGRTHEGLLTQLLRKKREPGVEDWVDEGVATAAAHAADAQPAALEDLWAFAEEWAGDRIAQYVTEEQGDAYTAEERAAGVETVNTGLRRAMGEDEDEDEEDEIALARQARAEEAARASGPGKVRSIDEIMGYFTTGITPEEKLAMSAGMR